MDALGAALTPVLAEPPGLYLPSALEQFAAAHPGSAWEDVEDTNHHSLILGPRGAEHVRAAIAHRLGSNSPPVEVEQTAQIRGWGRADCLDPRGGGGQTA